MYGKKGSHKAVPKRERIVEPEDILECFKLFRVLCDNGGEGGSQVVNSAARIVLSLFGRIDSHYIYTATPETNQIETNIVPDDACEVSDDKEQLEGNHTPRFITIL